MQDEGSNLSDSDNESQESLKNPFNREVPALDIKEYFARKTKENALNPSFHSPELMRRFERFRQSSKQDAPTKIVLKKDRVKEKLVEFPVAFDKESGIQLILPDSLPVRITSRCQNS
jgi:hypothetical protein